MTVHSSAFSSCVPFTVSVLLICSFSIVTVLCDESNDGKCVSLVNGPFDFCTKGGYNNTLPFPKEFTAKLQADFSTFLPYVIKRWANCSTLSLATAMECSFFVPKCGSEGKRVYPCRRVCGELLKHCQNQTDDMSEIYMDFFLASCLILPNETASSDKCFEPPNFTSNNNVPSPLDRGCQKLLIPACKNLGIYEHTLFSESVQKKFYKIFYNRTFGEGQDLEQGFPKYVEKHLTKFPKCSTNLKKLFCGDLLPPCFPQEGSPKWKTLCSSVCDEILRDCPTFFSENFIDAEFCAYLAQGSTSHGFCDRTDWPSPFFWLKYMSEPTTEGPTEEPTGTGKGPKGWVIAVAVLAALSIVGLGIAGIIWYKLRGGAPSWSGYKRQQDDTITPEQ